MARTHSLTSWTLHWLVVVLLWHMFTCGGIAGSNSNITVTVVCSVESDVMTAVMSFFYDERPTGIQNLFAYKIDRENITSQAECDLSAFTPGNFSATIVSSVNISDYSAVSNGCGHNCDGGVCDWEIGVRIVSPELTTKDDRNFIVTCNSANASGGQLVTGGVKVSDDSITRNVGASNPIVEMEVLKDGSPVTTAAIGDELTLLVTMQNPSAVEGESVKCVALYDCYAASFSDMVFNETAGSEDRLQFIGADGCELDNVMNLIDSFTRQSNTFSAVTGYECEQETGNFTLFSFLTNPDEIFFGCRYLLCSQADDDKCGDLCGYNPGGRRKRQAHDNDDTYQFTTKLGISPKATESPVESTEALKNKSVMTETLLIAFCVVLICLMAVTIAILVYIVKRNRRQRKEKEIEDLNANVKS